MRVLVKIKTIILIQLLFTAVALNAQEAAVQSAIGFIEADRLDSAKVYIERAVVHPETKESPEAWYLRGYIYKSIYGKKEKGNKKSPARLEALSSVRKSILFDKNKEFTNDNVALMQSLINSMHNDAGECLDPLEYETAIEIFRKSQEYFKIINPSAEAYQAREIEFALALGSVYNTIIETSKDSLIIVKYSANAKSLYLKVLSLDKNNIFANYNLGILYYNEAVKLIKSSEYVDITEINKLQDESIALFKLSLPFMDKALELDPKREATLQGLSGIWFSLNDLTKYNYYQKRLLELQKEKEKNK